jgi:hypothetical protein
MRLHQSRWRLEVRGVPCGTGPRRTSRALYGNKLRGERGLNFLVDPDATLQRWPLDRICRALEPLVGGTPHEPWLTAFRRGYAVPE